MHVEPAPRRRIRREIAGIIGGFTLSAGLCVLLTLAAVFPR